MKSRFSARVDCVKWLSDEIYLIDYWYRICIKQTKEMFNDSQIQMSIYFALPFPIKAIEDTNSREVKRFSNSFP